MENLLKHHQNMLLAKLDANAVEELVGYWRRRPIKKGTTEPMKAKSAGNYLGTLGRVFRWLHKDAAFDWRKPIDFEDIDTRVKVLPSDHARKRLNQVDTFSLKELRLLMRYASPMERVWILLALNCGFGRAEVASLLVGEVFLHQAHHAAHQLEQRRKLPGFSPEARLL